MSSAFDMAGNALDALNKLGQDRNVEDVAKWMFLKDDEKPGPDSFRRAKESYSGIVDMKNKVNRAAFDDVTVYCNTDRLKRTKDNRFYDEHLQGTHNEEDTKLLDNCGKADTTFMFVVNPANQTASILQICPWFVKYGRSQKYKTFKNLRDWMGRAGIMRGFAGKIADKWPYTEIDATSVFDKVMLHELTHTRKGGNTDDVLLGGKPTYGWKRCRELAQKGEGDPEEAAFGKPVTKKPQQNADSLALFGSAVRFITDSETRLKVTHDGKLEKIK